MSSYLQIAETVLAETRVPMTPRAILKHAYRHELVPSHLYGRTQHKTLQARLSEDVLARRGKSTFFRTAPGIFFLTQFLNDETIPPEHRLPMRAHRRFRDLVRGPALSVHKDALSRFFPLNVSTNLTAMCDAMHQHYVSYSDPKKAANEDKIIVMALAFVRRGGKVLRYRAGRYRENRDAFAYKQMLTFASYVTEDDKTLFEQGGFGIAYSAFSAAAVDLDMPIDYANVGDLDFRKYVKFISRVPDQNGFGTILAFVEVVSPDWFEPNGRRLSLNDLEWLDLSRPPNNLDDFDPWSQRLLEYLLNDESVSKGNRSIAATKVSRHL